MSWDAARFLGKSLIILDLRMYDLLGRFEAVLSPELIIPNYWRKTFLSTHPSAHEMSGLAGENGIIPDPVRVPDNVPFNPFGWFLPLLLRSSSRACADH